jgi:hypothetical protein
MSDQVKVEDLEVLRHFRVALLKFAQAAEQSLASSDSQIASTHAWLEGEQASYWQGQLRKRAEAVAQARETLRQKKLYKDATGRPPSAAEEEKALAQCVAAASEAQYKLEAVRKWVPKLERAADLYRGGVARLRTVVSGEIPRAVALLDRLAVTLEQYVQIETPSGSSPESAPAGRFDESMSRGGEAATAAPAAPAAPAGEVTAAGPTGPSEPPSGKEGGDVTDRK